MAPVRVTATAEAGRTAVVEVDTTDAGESLMVLVEVELSIPMQHQRILFQGRVIRPELTLAAQGFTGPTADVEVRQGSNSAPQDASRLVEQLFAGGGGGGAPQSNTPPPQRSSGAPVNPSPQQAAQLVQQLFSGGGGAAPPPQQPQYDPMDPDIQRRLMEQIERENIQQNMEQAIEHTPEAFSRVLMLYVKSRVDNNDIIAFVDSGAQMSIMNEATAERCGILRLLDRRMQGVAKGVGTGKILGKIHMALVDLGGEVVPMSITVIESTDIDFIIGLDQLKRHQMSIDLKDNVLRIGDKALPFLGEAELPRAYKEGFGREPSNSMGDEGGAQQAPPAAAAGGPSGGALTQAQEEKIARLQELSGADRPSVLNALEATQWREDDAASLLFE